MTRDISGPAQAGADFTQEAGAPALPRGDAPPHAVFALLDDASPDGQDTARSRLYEDHAGTLVCHAIADWPPLLDALQGALRQGLYAVPVLAYELGGQLLGIPEAARGGDAPLAQVLLFKHMRRLDRQRVAAWLAHRAAQEAVRAEEAQSVRKTAGEGALAGMRNNPQCAAGIAALRPSIGKAAFARAVRRILAYIAAGDTYQVNYTFRLRFDASGPASALYARLRTRQPVPYGALIALPDGRSVLSLSPELFIRNTGGCLEARPMKGTAAAGGDAGDNALRAQQLAGDPKNRAENLMIVDLLRNDLGRVARTGSVRVPALFEVRRYGAVLQMTSTVQAELAPHTALRDIFAALYPCGSITGAPKLRAMEIIRELEPDARGIYTGAIGWIDPPPRAAGPEAEFGDFCLSVPIRTLVLQPGAGVRRGEMGVGAGIVHDSEPAAEYAECRLKASFLAGLPPA